MEKLSYLATIIDEIYVDINLCDVVPDFVHAVKYDSENNIEVYFSADVDWTPAQEHDVMEQVLSNFGQVVEVY